MSLNRVKFSNESILMNIEETILEKIYQSALKFLEPLKSEEIYSRIVKEAVALVSADYGSLILDQKGDLVRVYSSSPTAKISIIRKQGYTYESFSSSQAFVVQEDELKRVHPEIVKMGIKSNLFIPLSYKGKSLGVLIVNSSKTKRFSNRELNILKLFGSLASLALRKTELYNEAQKALEIRDFFISMAAHELRTPLTSVNGYIQLLKNRYPSESSTEGKWIHQLWRESIRLTNLVHELLEVNKIKQGKLQFIWKECDLCEILKRALDNFKFTHPERKIIIKNCTAGKKCLVIGDYDKLIQLIINLVDNSAKFSQPDSLIMITLKKKKKEYLIEVIDQGVGISQNDIGRVFEGFYKGSNNLKEGMGLGLYLAKDIITKHHGSVNISSQENKGTKVELRLPATNI